MIALYLRSGQRIEFDHATAVTHTELPARPDETPAKALSVVTAEGRVLATFRLKEVAGYDVSNAGVDA